MQPCSHACMYALISVDVRQNSVSRGVDPVAEHLDNPSLIFRTATEVAELDFPAEDADAAGKRDRKSTRLNSSHGYISYAVFCLKKKKKQHNHTHFIMCTHRRNSL